MPSPVNLTKYAERIGFTGNFEPNFETLAAIQWLHSSSIPFDTLNVLLDLPVLIDIESLQEKLVNKKRGGYCFEQNGLLLDVLLAIGFEVTPMSARVRIGVERDFLPARTHLFLRVDLDRETWIVDAGVGGTSLTSPIRFIEDIEQPTLHETRRIVRENGVYFHQALMGETWSDVYEFTGEKMPLIDREVSNWWTSTSPKSKFKQNVFCALAKPDGERIGLFNDKFTHRRGEEILRSQTISNSSELVQILSDEFGIDLGLSTEIPLPWLTAQE